MLLLAEGAVSDGAMEEKTLKGKTSIMSNLSQEQSVV